MTRRGMRGGQRTLVRPIETMAREFDGKLLLALCAAERGWKVMIGSRAIKERVPFLPPCVYFAKSARADNSERFAQLNALGHAVVVLDEEALVRQSNDLYLMKHPRTALKDVDLVLTWGEDNAELWRQSDLLGDIHADPVGNPRVDMLRPQLRAFHEPEIAAIRARFGDYVLFNSNFATVNNVITGSNRLTLADWVPAEEAEREKGGLLKHKRAIFERFRSLLPKVAAAIAPRHLVIRPHPSEDHGPWQELASAQPNMSVAFEGSVVPWLAAASVLVHNGCTTAIEAAIAGTPVLSYRPVTSDAFDNPLPNAVGVECFDDEALLAALSRSLEGNRPPLTDRQQDLLARHIAIDGASLCCDAILDAIEDRGIGRIERPPAPLGVWLPIAARYQKIRFDQWRKRFSSKGRARAAYRAHKFPGLTTEIADERIARFRSALHRFEGMRARELRQNIVEIVA